MWSDMVILLIRVASVAKGIPDFPPSGGRESAFSFAQRMGGGQEMAWQCGPLRLAMAVFGPLEPKISTKGNAYWDIPWSWYVMV